MSGHRRIAIKSTCGYHGHASCFPEGSRRPSWPRRWASTTRATSTTTLRKLSALPLANSATARNDPAQHPTLRIITVVLSVAAGWTTRITLTSVLMAFFFSARIGVVFGLYQRASSAAQSDRCVALCGSQRKGRHRGALGKFCRNDETGRYIFFASFLRLYVTPTCFLLGHNFDHARRHHLDATVQILLRHLLRFHRVPTSE